MERFGIDISHWQNGLVLSDVKAAGAEFVIIKAAGGDAGLYTDKKFEDFYSEATANGFEVGAYFFGRAFSTAEAVKEANYFLTTLQGKDISHVFYDVEDKMLNQGYTHLTDIIKAFCETMTAAGYVCGVYSSESQFNSRFNDAQLAAYPHWVAKYSKSSPSLKSGNEVAIWQFGGSTNYLRSAKIAGHTVDQNYAYISLSNRAEVTSPDISGKTAAELAEEVIKGAYGSGSARRTTLGSRYDEVQAEVNRILGAAAAAKTTKTVEQLAVEVLAGVWGNDPARSVKLSSAGYDVKAVQAKVNEVIASRKAARKTYIVAKGDTLSAIAKRYNTTVANLQKANNLTNKNKIYVGQALVIA